MLSIRLARKRDADTIAVMSRELIEAGLGWSWTPSRVARSILNRETNVVVADIDSRIAGFALMHYFEEHAHLLLFAVSRENRRQSVGRTLWTWLERTALVAGISTVHLEVRAGNTPAREFYRQIGFTEAETVRGYYRGVEAAIRMRRRVSNVTHSSR